MSDLERFQQIVDELWELVFGTVRRPEVKFKDMMQKVKDPATKPKRARGLKGRYKGDDLSTAFTNEAWVGGKAPKKKRKK